VKTQAKFINYSLPTASVPVESEVPANGRRRPDAVSPLLSRVAEMGTEVKRTRVGVPIADRLRNALLEPTPESSVRGGSSRFQSLSAVATGSRSPRSDSRSPPPKPGLIHTGTGFSFESSAPGTPTSPTTETAPSTPTTPLTPSRIDSNASSFVRGGRHMAAVRIDWAATRKAIGEEGASSVRSSLSDLDRQHELSLAKASLPEGIAALEKAGAGSAGLERALQLARQIETGVVDDLRAAREHVDKQLNRSLSTLPNQRSLVKKLFKGQAAADLKRRATFNAVHEQARSHYQDRIGREDRVGEIFTTRDKSLSAAVVAGFKAEPGALHQPAHPLWQLRDLIAPGLHRDTVAAKLEQR
jgi:hypothetical protein